MLFSVIICRIWSFATAINKLLFDKNCHICNSYQKGAIFYQSHKVFYTTLIYNTFFIFSICSLISSGKLLTIFSKLITSLALIKILILFFIFFLIFLLFFLNYLVILLCIIINHIFNSYYFSLFNKHIYSFFYIFITIFIIFQK